MRLCETTFSLTDIPYYVVSTKDYSLDKEPPHAHLPLLFMWDYVLQFSGLLT